MNGFSKKAALIGRGMGKLSIGLVIPPSAFLLDERVFVSLGILKVASALERFGHRVSVLDLSGIRNYEDTLAIYLADADIDALGITATTPQLPAVSRITAVARRVRPDLKLILGGPHVTLTYSALKLEHKAGVGARGRAAKAARQLEDMFDVLCMGDGELAVLTALQPDSPKVVDGDDMRGPYFLSDETYNETPFPARHLVDLTSYNYQIEGHRSTSLIAQLGCPFSCGFCGGRNSKSLRVTRTRSVDSIVQEVEFLHRTYGYTGFMFYDDELNVNKSMVELMNRIADLQQRLGVEFRLRGFVKSELLTDEQAEAMYRAGFRWMLCGFEAASPRILTNIQKRATLDDNTRAVEIAKRHGLKTKALMSIGHPGESAETALAVKDWLIRMEVEDFDCTVITTYPGTPYYDQSVPHPDKPGVWTYTQPKTGDRLHTVEVDFATTPEYYKGDPSGGYISHVFTDHVSPEEIVALRDEIERDTRAALNIAFNPSRAALLYEHSMGQSLPAFILRTADGGADRPPAAQAEPVLGE
jgi:anaerobic magnesium-protoporphyrin IX monomethyl ester cyclase